MLSETLLWSELGRGKGWGWWGGGRRAVVTTPGVTAAPVRPTEVPWLKDRHRPGLLLLHYGSNTGLITTHKTGWGWGGGGGGAGGSASPTHVAQQASSSLPWATRIPCLCERRSPKSIYFFFFFFLIVHFILIFLNVFFLNIIFPLVNIHSCNTRFRIKFPISDIFNFFFLFW